MMPLPKRKIRLDQPPKVCGSRSGLNSACTMRQTMYAKSPKHITPSSTAPNGWRSTLSSAALVGQFPLAVERRLDRQPTEDDVHEALGDESDPAEADDPRARLADGLPPLGFELLNLVADLVADVLRRLFHNQHYTGLAFPAPAKP